MAIDLHVQTTASDGVFSPREVVVLAQRAALDAIAVTDHDSVDGLDQALQEGEDRGLLVIPGVELSSDADGTDVHILGYFVDWRSDALRQRLEALRDARRLRAERMVEALTKGGYPLTLQDVLRQSGEGAIGRAHIGRALVDVGHATSMRDAFEHFIGHGGPFYVKKPLAHPREVCRVIVEAGGLPVLAHPAVSRAEGLVAELVDAGLVGIEVYHSEHDAVARGRLLALAEEYRLLVTGGSDFHGHRGGVELGVADVPTDLLEPLMLAARR